MISVEWADCDAGKVAGPLTSSRCFLKCFGAVRDSRITGRAGSVGSAELNCWNPRILLRTGTVPPWMIAPWRWPQMVMLPGPLEKAIHRRRQGQISRLGRVRWAGDLPVAPGASAGITRAVLWQWPSRPVGVFAAAAALVISVSPD